MKAAVLTRYGPPDVVRIAEVDKPTPKGNELLIKVHVTTVNRTDCGYRAGKPLVVRLFYGLVRPRATVLGNEFAGEVEAVGSDVTSFEVGERVFGLNTRLFQAHAEYMVIPEDGSVAPIPANLTYEDAAPSTEGSTYAHSLIESAKIRSGQDVLVYGATGAIGSAAVQLLKSLGVAVTAACETKNVELVRGLGAGRVIDYTAQDFTKDDHEFDVVMDAVGKSSFWRCRRLLRPGGIYLSTDLGHLAQNLPLAFITARFGRKKVMLPVLIGPDRRGLQVCRDRAENRQCGDHRRSVELGAVLPT
jgi:NADPH:quinone reductase-like Zn-dependent oxidoreductase